MKVYAIPEFLKFRHLLFNLIEIKRYEGECIGILFHTYRSASIYQQDRSFFLCFHGIVLDAEHPFCVH